MAALVFVGLGVHGAAGLSQLGLEALRAASQVYLERYTSPVDERLIQELGHETRRTVTVVSREFVEDGRTLLEEAKKGTVVLLSPGDPIVATTHMELRIRAEQRGIKTSVVHNASILSSLPAETGLHVYSLGKPVTLTRSASVPLTTVYYTVRDNLLRGLHTAILLEYDYPSGFFLPPEQALRSLQSTESEHRRGVFHDDTFVVVASRIGAATQEVRAGGIRTLAEQHYGEPPHTLIVTGRLHFTELEALKSLAKMDGEEACDNASRIVRPAAIMVTKYVDKTKRALAKARARSAQEGRTGLAALFENVECYVADAERFLARGEEELAVLSVGYAEGLLDSLNFTGLLHVEWQ